MAPNDALQPTCLASLSFTPELQLQTLFVLNEASRIVCTRAPNPSPGPRFSLIRGKSRCAWAIRADIVTIGRLAQLEQNFRGWTTDDLAERAPIVGVIEGAHAVSICFCARRSLVAAEAGLETAPEFRGRGLGPRVTWAWAVALRTSGLLPLPAS